ncbi:UNVERIFIED_CONTAM: hypothetical protein RMT77_017306 [Armadillidium vulgare]
MILIIGASEISRVDQIRDYVREELGEEITIDSFPGRPLGNCIRVIQEQMTPETKIVLLWALTPLAWRRVNIEKAGRRFTVFAPNGNFSLNEVPQIMEDITTHVKSVNRNCPIFLVLPAIKDMYQFNQKRLVQNLGESHRHFLQNDLDLNPHRMRDFAIRAYQRFMELETDNFSWTNKNTLKANYAINRHFHLSGRDRRGRRERGWIPPHVRFMQSQSLSLNLYIMPDGLHGNADFMKNFVLAYRRVFQDCLRENNRNTQPQLASQERIQGLPSEHIAPSVSIPSREETSHEQPPELPPSNNIILQPVPWVPSSVIGSDHEDETERANPSIHRQIAPLSVNIPVLLGTRPRNNVSQSTTANQPNSLQGLPQSFLQEETQNLSPIVQRTIEEGIDNLVISTVSRNHTRHDRINVLQGIMAITNYKLQQLRN